MHQYFSVMPAVNEHFDSGAKRAAIELWKAKVPLRAITKDLEITYQQSFLLSEGGQGFKEEQVDFLQVEYIYMYQNMIIKIIFGVKSFILTSFCPKVSIFTMLIVVQ